METSAKTGLIAGAVVLALATPVGLTAYLTRDSDGAAVRPTAATPTYGDGTTTEAHELRLANIQLPDAANVPGTTSVEILDQTGRPVTGMVRNKTKLVHLYLVSTDLAVFQHLYPRLSGGTWSATATLPSSGSYRVVAEFTVDAGDHNDHVILGGDGIVPGDVPSRSRLRPADDAAAIAVEGAASAIESGRLRLHVTDRSGRGVELGSHLGAPVHVTAFHAVSGAMVHFPSIGKPGQAESGTVVDVGVEPTAAQGPYILFVELRAGEKVHLLRVPAILG